MEEATAEPEEAAMSDFVGNVVAGRELRLRWQGSLDRGR